MTATRQSTLVVKRVVVVLGIAWAAPAPVDAQVMDNEIYSFVRLEQAEYRSSPSADPFVYDAQAWVGGDYHRLWLRAEGERGRDNEGLFEGQALISRLVRPFWELQAGLRLDRATGDEEAATRTFLAVGLQGLAPYWFEVSSFLFVSHKGDVSGRLETTYDLLLSQRLILEPDVRIDVAIQDAPAFGVGSGLSSMELGARLRYEIVREVAPYVGWTWDGLFGGTADLAREASRPTRFGSWVFGLRLWR